MKQGILLPSPLFFIEFQIKHYEKRLAESRQTDNIAQTVFLRNELWNLKQQYNSYLN